MSGTGTTRILSKHADAAGTGRVYLLHFTQPYHHCAHYIGATSMPIDLRMKAHRGNSRYGRPARLIQALLRAGGDFVVADIWEFPSVDEAYRYERQLKKHHNTRGKCSICKAVRAAMVQAAPSTDAVVEGAKVG